MQNEYINNSDYFRHWSDFNSRELQTKDNLFFSNSAKNKHLTLTLFLFSVIGLTIFFIF